MDNVKCLLVDKAFFPRDKVCGDALSGKSVRLMRDLGILSDVENLNGAKINTITFGSPSNRQFDVSLINRKDKMGFPVPLKEWFSNELNDFIMDIFSTMAAKHRPYINSQEVLKNFGKEAQFSRKIWGLLSLELWHQEFHDKVHEWHEYNNLK